MALSHEYETRPDGPGERFSAFRQRAVHLDVAHHPRYITLALDTHLLGPCPERLKGLRQLTLTLFESF
jgi:hypothetical protein